MVELGLKTRSLSDPAGEARISILLAGEETAGRYGLVQTVEELGAESPRHLHHREDETLYIIEGSLSVWGANGWVEARTARRCSCVVASSMPSSPRRIRRGG